MTLDPELCRRAPKALLHDHLDGGLSASVGLRRTVVAAATTALFRIQRANGCSAKTARKLSSEISAGQGTIARRRSMGSAWRVPRSATI